MTILFIPALLSHDTQGFCTKLGIVVVLWLIVIFASMVDLITGIQASKRLGTKRTNSWGLRRTINKDLQYLGVLMSLLFIDIATSALAPYISIFEVPICSVAGVVCMACIEFLSVKENSQKGVSEEDNHLDEVERLAKDLVKSLGSDKAKTVIEVLQNSISQVETEGQGN